ncbi:proline-rich protein 2-like [Haemorhous mexicanus]|uniref:proline-rich protein 2-like n=1 Tax=Haemorhous mexicanus TaxID=30427 RepID=UPI0028BF3A34|nr:proline-rich protein 2-like [Haemorhous mexicanus]
MAALRAVHGESQVMPEPALPSPPPPPGAPGPLGRSRTSGGRWAPPPPHGPEPQVHGQDGGSGQPPARLPEAHPGRCPPGAGEPPREGRGSRHTVDAHVPAAHRDPPAPKERDRPAGGRRPPEQKENSPGAARGPAQRPAHPAPPPALTSARRRRRSGRRPLAPAGSLPPAPCSPPSFPARPPGSVSHRSRSGGGGGWARLPRHVTPPRDRRPAPARLRPRRPPGRAGMGRDGPRWERGWPRAQPAAAGRGTATAGHTAAQRGNSLSDGGNGRHHVPVLPSPSPPAGTTIVGVM